MFVGICHCVSKSYGFTGYLKIIYLWVYICLWVYDSVLNQFQNHMYSLVLVSMVGFLIPLIVLKFVIQKWYENLYVNFTKTCAHAWYIVIIVLKVY